MVRPRWAGRALDGDGNASRDEVTSIERDQMKQQAKNRTLGQRFVDWRWGKHTKLPAPRTDYTTTYDVRIPMRDGVELLANLLEPKGTASGTVLVASPYGINMVGQAMTGGVMAPRGHRGVLGKSRGTLRAGGTLAALAAG